MAKSLGFIGPGEVSERKTRTLLNDALDAPDSIGTIVLPVTKATWHPRLETVAEWALGKDDVAIVVVTDDTTEALTKSRTIDKKLVAEVLMAAKKTHKVVDVPTKLAKVLRDDDGDLWTFWDADDEPTYDAFEAAWGLKVPVYDACSGLEQMRFEEEQPEGEEPLPDDEALAAKEEPEPDDEGEEAPAAKKPFPSTDELADMEIEQVKFYAKKLGIEFPQRTRVTTYIKAIEAYFENQDGAPNDEDEPVSKVPDEDVSDVPDDNVADLSERRERKAKDDNSNVDPGTGEVQTLTEAATGNNYVATGAWQTFPPQTGIICLGNCLGCGGPYYAEVGSTKVEEFHGRRCSVDGSAPD